MKGLGKIIATPKDGHEAVSFNGINTGYTLVDFWRWSSSDLVSNTMRGLLAEFIVGTALKFDPAIPRQEWEAYDLLFDNRIRIEVKSSAYIQSWNQKKLSPIIFSIKPTKYWDPLTGIESETRRHSDVYVFCHLKHTDQETIDPLKTEQWDFYVLSTKILNELMPGKSSISLENLKTLKSAIPYSGLYEQIVSEYQINGSSTQRQTLGRYDVIRKNQSYVPGSYSIYPITYTGSLFCVLHFRRTSSFKNRLVCSFPFLSFIPESDFVII